MYNLNANVVKILVSCKLFSKDLVNGHGEYASERGLSHVQRS